MEKYLPSFFMNFWREKAGTSVYEYALMISLIVVVCAIVLLALSKAA